MKRMPRWSGTAPYELPFVALAFWLVAGVALGQSHGARMAHDAMRTFFLGVGGCVALLAPTLLVEGYVLAARMRSRTLLAIAGRAALGAFAVMLGVASLLGILVAEVRDDPWPLYLLVFVACDLSARELAINAGLLVQAERDRSSVVLQMLALGTYGGGAGLWLVSRISLVVLLFQL